MSIQQASIAGSSQNDKQILRVLMDYAAILFTKASGLSCSLSNGGELLSCLQALKKPLKESHMYARDRSSSDVEMHNLLQRLLSSLSALDNDVLRKIKWKSSVDLKDLDVRIVPYIKSIDHDVSSLIMFLKRIGLLTSAWSSSSKSISHSTNLGESAWAIPRPINENLPSGSLWPLLSLPDRNLSYLPREAAIEKVTSSIQPEKKPSYVCLVNKGGVAGNGKSQLILESAYRCIEEGRFGIVFWVTCLSQMTLMLSYYEFARKISLLDPQFADLLRNFDGEKNFRQCMSNFVASKDNLNEEFSLTKHSIVIAFVVMWLNQIPMPYLVVFDKADDLSFISSDMFPRIGQGNVLISTSFSQISTWAAVLDCRPKAIELTKLSNDEGLDLAKKGLDTTELDQSDKEAIVELLNICDFSPVEFSAAIINVNCIRNNSFLNIGPRDYLDRLKSETSGPSGLVGLSDGNNGSALSRIDLTYRSVQMRFYAANDFEHACEATHHRVFDLLSFMSTSGISSSIIFKWLSPESIYSPMRVRINLNKLTGTNNSSSRKDHSDSEVIIRIQSYIPRILQNNGDYYFNWEVFKTFKELENFISNVSPHCSSCLRRDILSRADKHEQNSFSHEAKFLGKALVSICNDPFWPNICKMDFVKKFLNIHANDNCEDSHVDKVSRIIDPLVAVGLINVEQAPSEVGTEGHSSQRGELFIGIHRSIQDSNILIMEQEKRFESVACEVFQFLIDLIRSSLLEEGDLLQRAITNNPRVQEFESLLPHVLRIIHVNQIDIKKKIDLCLLCYPLCETKELYYSAEVIARKLLNLYKRTNGTAHSMFLSQHKEDKQALKKEELETEAHWQYKVCLCLLRQDKFHKGIECFKIALKLRRNAASDPSSDFPLARIEKEFADCLFCAQQFDEALLHYESSLHVCRNLLMHRQPDSFEFKSLEEQVRAKMISLYLHFEMYSKAESIVQEFIGDKKHLLPSRGANVNFKNVEQLLHMMHRRALILYYAGNFESAKALLIEVKKEYHCLYGDETNSDGSLNKDFEFAYQHLQNKISLQCNLSECFRSLALYDDAKQYLDDGLTLFERFVELSPHSYQQNTRAFYRLKISVLESLIDLHSELFELEAAHAFSVQAKSLCEKLYGANHHKTSLMCCRIGSILKSLGRFNEATDLFKRVLSMTDKNIRLDGAVVALNGLADMSTIQGDFIGAEKFLLDALKLLQYKFKNIQGKSLEVANEYILLAELKKEQHLFENAKEYYDSALQIQLTCLGEVHIAVAHTLECLADLFSDRGENRSAKNYRDQSAAIYDQLRERAEKEEGHGHPHLPTEHRKRSNSSLDALDSRIPSMSAQMSTSALSSMASLISNCTANNSSAESMHSQALRILSSQYGKGHPRVALALNNLGKVLSKKGQVSQAQAMMKTAIDILRKVHGDNHPHVAAALHNLGLLFGEQKQYEEAIKNVSSSLKIRRLVAGGNSLILSESLSALGFFFYQVGQSSRSLEALEECLQLRRQLYSSAQNKHPIAVTLNNLGLVAKSLLKYSRSEECMRESLQLRLICYGDPNVDISDVIPNKERNHHPSIAYAWSNLGWLLTCMGKYHEARMLLENALSARTLHYGKANEGVANTMHHLAELSILEKRFGDASVLYKEIVEIRVSLYGEDSPLVHATMRRFLNDYASIEKVERKNDSPDRKILFGSQNETEVYRRVRTEVSRIDSTPDDGGDDGDENMTTKKLLPCTSVSRAREQDQLLSMMLGSFEDDLESNSAAQFMKFESSKGSHAELISQTPQISTPYSSIEGGDGWPERVMQKMIHDKNAVITELSDHEAELIEKRNTYEIFETDIQMLRESWKSAQNSLVSLESKLKTDKRLKYDYEACKKDEMQKRAALEKREADKEMSKLLVDLRELEGVVERKEEKLKSIDKELGILGRINTAYKKKKASIDQIDAQLHSISKNIEALRWKLVHVDEYGAAGQSTAEDHSHELAMSEVSESASRGEISRLIRSKVELDIAREMEEICYQRAVSALENMRMRFGIAKKCLVDPIPQPTGPVKVANDSKAVKMTDRIGVDEDFGGDDSDEEEENIDEGESASEDKSKKLRRKIKKQGILIDLLRNQIMNLGHKPIEEVLTFSQAEARLQNALSKLMDGDETASDDFDKWDEFVRNHPEFKARELRRKERFKKENFAVNKACLRFFRTLVPPGIVSTCTLATLEESLPKTLAKRVWLTKALWLVRMDATRIARLHVADLQSKYSTQGLDELELRAIYASLPEKFDNDAKGDKAAWCESILQSIQSKCKALPWSTSGDEEAAHVEPTEDDVAAYIKDIPRNPTYRNFSESGPYDPDEEAVVIENAASSKDEISSREEMLRVMDTLHSEKNVSAGNDTATEEKSAQRPTTSSIRRRASMFGTAKAAPTRKKESAAPAASSKPAAPSFLSELKSKANKKGPSSSDAGKNQGPNLLGEIQSAALKKQAKRNSIS